MKCLGGISNKGASISGHFEIVQSNGRPLYALSLPKGGIRQIYFGIPCDSEASDALYHQARAAHPDLLAYECSLDVDSLSVGFRQYGTLAEAATK